MFVNVERLVADHGSVVVFEGATVAGKHVRFAADHRPAQDIVSALEDGQDVHVEIEDWQLLGGGF